MLETDAPSSVLLEYKPKSFGAGTTKNRIGNKDVIEQHSHRRKSGAKDSRSLHVADVAPDGKVTSLRLTPGEEYQAFHIRQQGADITHRIEVNHTHFLITALKPFTGKELEVAKYTWSGDQVPMEPRANQLPLGLYNETLAIKTEQPPLPTVPLLPSLGIPQQLNSGEAAFLKLTGETIRSHQSYLSPVDVIRLSTIISDHKPQQELPSHQPALFA